MVWTDPKSPSSLDYLEVTLESLKKFSRSPFIAVTSGDPVLESLLMYQFHSVCIIPAGWAAAANVDGLFDLAPPAACFHNPELPPWNLRRPAETRSFSLFPLDLWSARSAPHGFPVPSWKLLADDSGVARRFPILLRPSTAAVDKYRELAAERTLLCQSARATGLEAEARPGFGTAVEAAGADQWAHIHEAWTPRGGWQSRFIDVPAVLQRLARECAAVVASRG